MLRLKNLSNKYQKRLIRPEYAQTQGTPYAVTLDDTFRDADGGRKLPLDTDTTPLGTRSADAFQLKGGIISGLVAVRTKGERVAIATGADSGTEVPFGLLANFVGGELDDIGDEDQVGVWRGVGSTYTLLAPAFDPDGLSGAFTAAPAVAGNPVLLFAGADGRLKHVSGPNADRIPVARLIDIPSASRIVVDLLV